MKTFRRNSQPRRREIVLNAAPFKYTSSIGYFRNQQQDLKKAYRLEIDKRRGNTMTETYDCLIIGYNDIKFEDYVNILKGMGKDHADYRDLDLNFVRYKGKPYRSIDLLNHFFYQDKEGGGKPFHHAELIWMCVSYLATFIAKRGFNFDYINLFHMEKDLLIEKLQKNRYLTVVVTTTIYNFEHPIMEVISLIRQYDTSTRIIVGGPYVSKRAERLETDNLVTFFKYINADFYVCGREGELALVEILNALKNNEPFHQIDNIAFKSDNGYIVNRFSSELNSLEENMIDYSLFPAGDIGGFVNLRVSKGCPYKCSFCGFPLRSRKYNYISLERIKRELDALRDVGTVTHLHFIDDTFNVPKKRFRQVIEMMIKEKYTFKWNCYFRCDVMDEDIVPLMKEAGCEGVFLGIESANDTILKNMNKRAGKKFYRKAIPLFKKAGIAIFASIFIGFPGETLETFKETIDFLIEMEPDFYRAQLWYCDTLTPIWQEREKYGLTGNHFAWAHHTMDSKVACHLLEESMLSLDIPVWVPDPGYNYVGIYHLGQRGMSFDKQKVFLSCFNTAVKEKLLFPGLEEPSPRLLESIKQSCLFDEAVEPDMEPVQALSAARFRAAQFYWIEQFKLPSPGRYPLPGQRGNFHVSHSTGIPPQLLEMLQRDLQAGGSDLLLAAYSAMLLRLKGKEDITIVTSPDEGVPFPLRFYPTWSMPFRQLVQIVGQKAAEVTEHRPFAFYILTHPLRKVQYPDWSTCFDTAFLFTREMVENALDDRLPPFPTVLKTIDLAFEVIAPGEGRMDIRFGYSDRIYSFQTIEKYHTHITSILQAVAGNPGIPLADIPLESQTRKRKPAVTALAGEAFNF
jgi:radical SAM PhpK family P-methyltransferase